MAQTMKAAVVHAFGQPLTIEQVPIPEPGPDQVLIRVTACGVVPMSEISEGWREANSGTC